jgi:hypothetical protein
MRGRRGLGRGLKLNFSDGKTAFNGKMEANFMCRMDFSHDRILSRFAMNPR